MTSLIAWKKSPDRKPLLLTGARQVGKTWLMKEFGKNTYKNTVYIDFFNNEQARKIFDGDLKPRRIVEELGFISGETIRPGETLVIFDEIQESNRGLNSLKYFCEQAPEYHIIAAGSFLGISLHLDESFPVGKTDSLTLHPMTFTEFLTALGENRLVSAMVKHELRQISLVKNDLLKYLKYYYYVGGMPEAVLAFTKEKNFKKIRALQKKILSDYENDFSKHIGFGSADRVTRIWNSIPAQLAREKKKFVYNDVKQSAKSCAKSCAKSPAKSPAKSRDYRSALFWLSKCGLVHEVCRITIPHYPLISYADANYFKLYMLDIGLLSAMSDLDIEAFLDRDSAVFDHFYGALSEQFVLQELKALENIPVYYWAREGSSKAKVDFVIQLGSKIIPLEVKAEKNLKAKSLKVFIDMYKPPKAIRSSLADLGQSTFSGCTIYEIPLFLAGELLSMC